MPQFVKLSTLCKIKYGKDHKKLSTGFVPVYGSGGVMRYVNDALHDKPSVLIPRKGTLGNLFYVDKPFWTVDTLFWTDIDTTKVLPHFFYYSLKIKKIANLNVGTAVPSLTTSVLNDVEIYLPSLREQQRIVNILAPLDDKIELNRKMNENLEQQASALFKHWFVDFEFPDANGNPYRSSGGNMKESSLGMIPEEWNVGVLGNIASIASGKRPATKSTISSDDVNIPLLGASSVMGYTNQFLYDDRILVIGRVGTHGVIQRFSKKCWPSDNTLVLKCNYYEFLYHVLKSIDYNNINRGSTQPLITQNDVKNTSLIIPSADILIKFEEMLYSFMHRCAINDEEIVLLNETRDRLLIKLINN